MALTATLPTASDHTAAAVTKTRGLWTLLGLGLAALWIICWRHLSAEWSYNEQYNYGWFVPFFAAYLFWMRWEDRPAPATGDRKAENGKSIAALFVAIGGLLLLFPIRLIEIANPDWRLLSWAHTLIAVTLTLLLIWWLGGRPWLRHFAFPICFLLISVPWLTGIEQPIIQGLMPTVATIATETLSLFGIPAEVQGNLIRINGGVVGVSEACSGVRSLQTSIMIGLLFGELKRLSVGRRIALVVAAVGIAFLANCGRAFFLVWIAASRGVAQVEHWHDMAGYAIVGLVFVGCLGLTKLLSHQPPGSTRPAHDTSHQSPLTNHHLPRLPSAAFLISPLIFLVLVEFSVELWYRAHEQGLQRSAQWNVRWPEGAPQFRDVRIDDRTRALLHCDEGRGAIWTAPDANRTVSWWNSSNSTSLLYFFRWYPGHNSALLANAHRPDVCLPASGWRQTGDFGVRSYDAAPGLAIPFRHFEFKNDTTGSAHFAHAFYCVWEDRVPKDAAKRTDGMANAPSSWTRGERLEAVKEGRRHLGQQVMEYLLISAHEMTAEEAEQVFSAKVHDLIAPTGPALADARATP